MNTLEHIALAFTPGLGNASLRKLIDLYPDENIFDLPLAELRTAFGHRENIINDLHNKSTFRRAEEELAFCETNNIRPLFFTDADYPARLNRPECDDCPALLYALGSADLNAERAIAIVGTRRATHAGRDNTAQLVQQLKAYNTPIVSGLAYGIDTAAHSAALDQGMPTVAVLGHGLDRIYPPENRPLAKRIIDAGGALLTEYPSGTAINPRYFPARNRIIAALADATIVVEASEKGGALITAAIASSYQRDVFAVPGRLTDTYSRGTNNLIATNRALLLRSADDIAAQLGWPQAGQQLALAEAGSSEPIPPAEQKVLDILRQHDRLALDEVASLAGLPLPKAAALLFNLEMSKRIHTLPGHLYQAGNA